MDLTIVHITLLVVVGFVVAGGERGRPEVGRGLWWARRFERQRRASSR
jgi:hypothetical protein